MYACVCMCVWVSVDIGRLPLSLLCVKASFSLNLSSLIWLSGMNYLPLWGKEGVRLFGHTCCLLPAAQYSIGY